MTVLVIPDSYTVREYTLDPLRTGSEAHNNELSGFHTQLSQTHIPKSIIFVTYMKKTDFNSSSLLCSSLQMHAAQLSFIQTKKASF